MHKVESSSGTAVSYFRHGSGPPLVLVHGSFSDQTTNWEFVLPHFESRFTVYAMARRGRGETSRTEGHRIEDEAADLAALIGAVGEPVFLLGHSYGAHVAVGAAAVVPRQVRKLVLYEPPWPHALGPQNLGPLEDLARSGDWDGFARFFFRGVLFVPPQQLDTLRHSDLWPPIVADGRATLGDLRALARYDFDPVRFAELPMPVLLQTGTESPPDLYVTGALLRALPDARIQKLAGQAHEGMMTAPEAYARAVTAFLLE